MVDPPTGDEVDPNLSSNEEKSNAKKRKEGPNIEPIRKSKRFLSDESVRTCDVQPESPDRETKVVSAHINDEDQMGGGIGLYEMDEDNGDYINVHKIDFCFLERKICQAYQGKKNSQECKQICDRVLQHLEEGVDEKGLHQLLQIDAADLVNFLWKNRSTIVCGVHLATFDGRVQRTEIANKLKKVEDYKKIVNDLSLKRKNLCDFSEHDKKRFLKGVKCNMPKKSHEIIGYGGCEVFVVPERMNPSQELIEVSTLPEKVKGFFRGKKTLNRVQSRVFEKAVLGDADLLVSAPTGLGDSSVVELIILRLLSLYENSEYLVVFVTPSSSHVSQLVGDLAEKLRPFGAIVKELSGGNRLSLSRQIEDANILVSIPGKLDIITELSGPRLKVLIFDGFQMLSYCDLQNMIDDTIERVKKVRLVGLSAISPNHEQRKMFSQVGRELCHFNFDVSVRQVPLEQWYVGISVKGVDRSRVMSHVCYKKILPAVKKRRPVVIFVHSETDAIQTAREIRYFALAYEPLIPLSVDLKPRETTDLDLNLDDLLPYGLAMHHHGMNKTDRNRAKNIFFDDKTEVKILISTPSFALDKESRAHTVIIKGTESYNQERGVWTELEPSDVIQMLHCARMPSPDSTPCRGFILTKPDKIHYYVSLMNKDSSRIDAIVAAHEHLNLDNVTKKGTYKDEKVEVIFFQNSKEECIIGFEIPKEFSHRNLYPVYLVDRDIGFALVSDSGDPLSTWNHRFPPYQRHMITGSQDQKKIGYILTDIYKIIFKDILTAVKHLHRHKVCLVGNLSEANVKVTNGRAALCSLRLQKNATEKDFKSDYVKVADLLDMFVERRCPQGKRGNYKLLTDFLRGGNVWRRNFAEFERLATGNVILMTDLVLEKFYKDAADRRPASLEDRSPAKDVMEECNMKGWGQGIVVGSPLYSVYTYMHRTYHHNGPGGFAEDELISFFRNALGHMKDYTQHKNMKYQDILWDLEVQFPGSMFCIQLKLAESGYGL